MYLGAGGIEYFECTISNQKADILFNFDIFFLKQKIYRNQKKIKIVKSTQEIILQLQQMSIVDFFF